MISPRDKRKRKVSVRPRKRKNFVSRDLFLSIHNPTSASIPMISPVQPDLLVATSPIPEVPFASSQNTNASTLCSTVSLSPIDFTQCTISVPTPMTTQSSRKKVSVRTRVINNAKRSLSSLPHETTLAAPPSKKRKRTPNLHLLKFFPRDVLSITNTGIHNLTMPEYKLCSTPRPLSAIETLVLSFGPQFIPTPRTLNIPAINTIVDDYANTLRRNYYFATHPSQTNTYTTLDKLVRIQSTFVPPTASKHIESYLNHVKLSLLSIAKTPRIQYPNTAQYERACYDVYRSNMMRKIIISTIKSLRNDDTILFKKCDKNLGLSVIPREWYENQALVQLTDQHTYKSIDDTAIPTVLCLFDDLRKTIHGHKVPMNVQSFLFSTETTCISPATTSISPSKFYLLPKIHKTPISTRPIVASMSSCTYNTSKYVDYLLKPVMHSFSQILNSPVDLLRHLNITSFPPNCVFLTADVTSLYPSIDLIDGLEKIGLAIDMYNANYDDNVDKSLVVKLCKWVLYNNFVAFGNSVWLQIRGTAMGTPMAVVFANLYLAMLENFAFKRYYDIYPEYYSTVLLFVRFIDDILAILLSPEHCTVLLELLNSMHPTISITYNVSDNSVDFLDMTIHKGSLFPTTSILDIKPYQKPMNAYLYIPIFSYHSPFVFKAFIQSEKRRYCLLSTSGQDAARVCNLFRTRLIARGYPPTYLDNLFRIQYCRSDLLFPPPIRLLYGTLHTQYNPRPAALFPFQPPKPVYAIEDDHTINAPIIFKLPHTPTFLSSYLRNVLSFSTHLQFEPILRLTTHPLICNTRTANIGDLLICAEYNFVVPK